MCLSKHNSKILFNALLVVFVFGLWINSSTINAYTNQEPYPRIGNYYLRAGTDITPNTIPLLARYDLLILPAEAQIQNENDLKEIRKQNPDIIILAYIPAVSFNLMWYDELHTTLRKNIAPEWWLRDNNNNRISLWPRTYALNLSEGWAEYLASFIQNNVMKTELWDGVLIDEVDDCISCAYPNIDLNRDGNIDESRIANLAWRAGFISLLKQTRALLGPNALILTNGSSTIEYQPYTNGRMFESFPTPWEGDGTWEYTLNNRDYLSGIVGVRPPLFYFAGDSENTGIQTDYQDMRLGLTSALLSDAYFGYDVGTENHGQLWWFDEYNIFLGNPRSNPTTIPENKTPPFTPDVWRRDFEKGLVLVNSTDGDQTIALGEDFEKIHGNQDTETNDGSIISHVRVPAMDGLILLRLSEDVFGVTFPNGAFTRIFSQNEDVARTGFFLYDARFNGSEKITRIDLDTNGSVEAIQTKDGKVMIINQDGSEHASFAPYGEGYRGRINVAIGDTNGNGFLELITSPEADGGPHIRIFSHEGRLLSPGFFAFDKKFRGGVNIAAGDVNGDGKDEIITAIATRGVPEIRIFRANGEIINNGFMAYAPSFRGGVNIAAGDVNGDGKDEIITGAGKTGGPHVRIFDENGTPNGRGFFPYDPNRRDGVQVGAYDIDGDGTDEILAITTDILP